MYRDAILEISPRSQSSHFDRKVILISLCKITPLCSLLVPKSRELSDYLSLAFVRSRELLQPSLNCSHT